jgi:integrase
MDDQPHLRFHRPKGMDALFKLGKPAADPKVPTVEEVRKLYAACRNDDERLYMLLGINCGMYEVDISALTPAALQMHKGEQYLVWKRQKTSHQSPYTLYHWLFPETAALIDSQRAPENAHGRLLLNRYGEPLAESKVSGHRTKAITEQFPAIVKRAGLAGKGISFKSLRKFGAHELRAQAAHDKDNLARKYLGQAVPGVLRHYVRDDFEDLTAELKRFHERLLAAKVLPTDHGSTNSRSGPS